MVEEADAALAQGAHGGDDVGGRGRCAGRRAAVELEVLLDLRLALALGGLVDRELDPPLPSAITFDISAEYSVGIASVKRIISVKPKTRS